MSSAALQRLSEQQLDALVQKAGGPDQVVRILSGEIEIQLLAPAPAERFVLVTADTAFEDRIRRGHYGWRNSDLTEPRFPVDSEQSGAFEQRLFHFNRSLSSDQAICEIRDAGYEPGRIGDILVFGERYPEEQRRHPVIGLGSVASIDRIASVPALWFDGDRRTLDLIWYDGDWHRNYRFLGVRRTDVAPPAAGA
jgi:hypothetical protein